jgi:hypothetical protein
MRIDIIRAAIGATIGLLLAATLGAGFFAVTLFALLGGLAGYQGPAIMAVTSRYTAAPPPSATVAASHRLALVALVDAMAHIVARFPTTHPLRMGWQGLKDGLDGNLPITGEFSIQTANAMASALDERANAQSVIGRKDGEIARLQADLDNNQNQLLEANRKVAAITNAGFDAAAGNAAAATGVVEKVGTLFERTGKAMGQFKPTPPKPTPPATP